MAPTVKLTVGARLGNFFCSRKEEILARWLKSVTAEQEDKTANRLTEEELRDHLGQLLADLQETLLKAFDPEIREEMKSTAAAHGKERWKEGYRIDEVILELAVLRALMIGQIFEFLEANPDVGGAACIFISTTVHRFLDDAIRASVTEFLKKC